MTLESTQRARRSREYLRVEAWQQYGPCSGCGRTGRTDVFYLFPESELAKNIKMANFTVHGARFYSILRRLGWPEGFKAMCSDCNDLARMTFTEREAHFLLRKEGIVPQLRNIRQSFIDKEVELLLREDAKRSGN